MALLDHRAPPIRTSNARVHSASVRQTTYLPRLNNRVSLLSRLKLLLFLARHLPPHVEFVLMRNVSSRALTPASFIPSHARIAKASAIMTACLATVTASSVAQESSSLITQAPPAAVLTDSTSTASTQDTDGKLYEPAKTRAPQAKLDLFGDHTFSSDLSDADGSFAVSRVGVGLQMLFPVFETAQIGVGINAKRWEYDFEDAFVFDSVDGDPWQGINDFDLTLSFSKQINEKWSYFFGGSVQSSAADGADFSDSISAAGFGGATYAFSDTFSLGGGVIVRQPLEDDVEVVPVITMDWKLAEEWRFTIAPNVGRRLAGLVYTPSDAFEIAFGGGIEYNSFRLDDEGPAPEGVGRYRRVPLGIDLTWNISQQVSLSGYGGVMLFQELTLDDSEGERIEQEESDLAPFAGIGLQFRF